MEWVSGSSYSNPAHYTLISNCRQLMRHAPRMKNKHKISESKSMCRQTSKKWNKLTVGFYGFYKSTYRYHFIDVLWFSGLYYERLFLWLFYVSLMQPNVIHLNQKNIYINFYIIIVTPPIDTKFIVHINWNRPHTHLSKMY